MRLTFCLLLASAATLLVNGNALSATSNTEKTSLSEMTSPDHVDKIVGQTDGEVKRFLRRHKKEQSNEDDGVEEERFKLPKIEKMLTNESYRNMKFNKWKYQSKASDTAIYNRLRVDENPLYRTLFYKYQNY